jgi:hypothetical protein
MYYYKLYQMDFLYNSFSDYKKNNTFSIKKYISEDFMMIEFYPSMYDNTIVINDIEINNNDETLITEFFDKVLDLELIEKIVIIKKNCKYKYSVLQYLYENKNTTRKKQFIDHDESYIISKNNYCCKLCFV